MALIAGGVSQTQLHIPFSEPPICHTVLSVVSRISNTSGYALTDGTDHLAILYMGLAAPEHPQNIPDVYTLLSISICTSSDRPAFGLRDQRHLPSGGNIGVLRMRFVK